MLKDLKIEGFRGFKKFEVTGLNRVNLLVGRNNSGKTALLEAIHFFTSGGEPQVLIEALQRRGEDTVDPDDGSLSPDLSHWFYGHKLSSKSNFQLSGNNGLSPIQVYSYKFDSDPQSLPKWYDNEALLPTFRVDITGTRPHKKVLYSLFVTQRGGLTNKLNSAYRRRRIQSSNNHINKLDSVFISTAPATTRSLASMWREVLDEKQEKEVLESLRILEPNLEDIIFDPSFRNSFRFESSGILIGMKDLKRRLPLGTLGDGMRRLLALTVSLINAKNGCLFIDEIDTGLHYSIMPRMWELVTRTAERLNIQVFATTHSWDCIEGLAELCRENPDLMPLCSVQTIDPQLPKSVSYEGDAIVRLVKHQIDPR